MHYPTDPGISILESHDSERRVAQSRAIVAEPLLGGCSMLHTSQSRLGRTSAPPVMAPGATGRRTAALAAIEHALARFGLVAHFSTSPSAPARPRPAGASTRTGVGSGGSPPADNRCNEAVRTHGVTPWHASQNVQRQGARSGAHCRPSPDWTAWQWGVFHRTALVGEFPCATTASAPVMDARVSSIGSPIR